MGADRELPSIGVALIPASAGLMVWFLVDPTASPITAMNVPPS